MKVFVENLFFVVTRITCESNAGAGGSSYATAATAATERYVQRTYIMHVYYGRYGTYYGTYIMHVYYGTYYVPH